jgi:hypothetical protein
MKAKLKRLDRQVIVVTAATSGSVYRSRARPRRKARGSCWDFRTTESSGNFATRSA